MIVERLFFIVFLRKDLRPEPSCAAGIIWLDRAASPLGRYGIGLLEQM
jgi:hypothetical protein